jgi:TPR repeat protein
MRTLVLVLGLLAAPLDAQSLDDARAAFAMTGRVEEAARLARPLAAAGQAEALALLGLIARDAIPPEVETARALLESAAASGSPTALVALGRAHQTWAAWPSPDPRRALAFITSAPWLQEAGWRRST